MCSMSVEERRTKVRIHCGTCQTKTLDRVAVVAPGLWGLWVDRTEHLRDEQEIGDSMYPES